MSIKPLIGLILVLVFGPRNSLETPEEDSKCLSWGVRRLVGETENLSETSPPNHPVPESSTTGSSGVCICDPDEVVNLKQAVRELERKIRSVEVMNPESICLLGMKSGSIPDSAIRVSSTHSADYCLHINARLDHYGAWCAGSNSGDQWIEVDLGKIHRATGVITQGANHPVASEWVTAFKVEYGTSVGSRMAVMENNRTKVFSPVNFDKNTKVVSRFPKPVLARYIRIIPTSYHIYKAMRVDVISC